MLTCNHPIILIYRGGSLTLDRKRLLVRRDARLVSVINLEQKAEVAILNRRSFKHPIIGAIFGSLLLLPVSAALAFTVQHQSLSAFLYRGGAAMLAAALFGLYLLYKTGTSKTIPWLHVNGNTLPLPGVAAEHLRVFVQEIQDTNA